MKSKHPKFPVFTRSSPFAEIPRLAVSVGSVFIDAADDELDFVAADEPPVVFVKSNIGKVDEKHEAENCSTDGHEAEDDKDPAPTFQATQPSLFRLIMCFDSEEVEWVIPFAEHHTPEYRNIRMLQARDCRRLRTASAYHIERT